MTKAMLEYYDKITVKSLNLHYFFPKQNKNIYPNAV